DPRLRRLRRAAHLNPPRQSRFGSSVAPSAVLTTVLCTVDATVEAAFAMPSRFEPDVVPPLPRGASEDDWFAGSAVLPSLPPDGDDGAEPAATSPPPEGEDAVEPTAASPPVGAGDPPPDGDGSSPPP